MIQAKNLRFFVLMFLITPEPFGHCGPIGDGDEDSDADSEAGEDDVDEILKKFDVGDDSSLGTKRDRQKPVAPAKARKYKNQLSKMWMQESELFKQITKLWKKQVKLRKQMERLWWKKEEPDNVNTS